MVGANEFAKMVPGFDFLQGLLKGASAGLPPMGQWVAPTLDPDELDKRIQEFKTVQFWLEQNARLLGTTIQALEVQRMTLSTLRSMNLPLADLSQALQARAPASPAASAAPPATAATAAAPMAAWASALNPAASGGTTAAAAAGGAGAEQAEADEDAADSDDAAPMAEGDTSAAPPAVDPMQWWGALTQQFTQIATQALKDAPAVGSVAQQGLEAMRSALGKMPGTQAADKSDAKARAPAKGSQSARSTTSVKTGKTGKTGNSASSSANPGAKSSRLAKAAAPAMPAAAAPRGRGAAKVAAKPGSGRAR